MKSDTNATFINPPPDLLSPKPMATAASPIREIQGEPLNDAQRRYLDGFFAGLAARGLKLSGAAPPPSPDRAALADLTFEERVKREMHPLDAYPRLLENASRNQPPDKEDVFRFKWHGLFYLAPCHQAFMARLRIPGGQLKTFQWRELAHVAKDLATGYVQITTRANLQLRLIAPKDAPEVLRRIQSVGLLTRGAGADNIRNLTANPTAGIDPNEIVDVSPYCRELAEIIANDRAFYDLPRKFNIAFDGGGLIGALEETNDIGVKAHKSGDEIFFRIALGGATGHRAFARDLGVRVAPPELNKVIVAMIRVFIAHGSRADRKRARLKHLLEDWPLERFLAETEKALGRALPRAPAEPGREPSSGAVATHSHLGVWRQKQAGLNYIGVALPAGQLTPKQMTRVAEIAELYGAGEIRLTVWQNFIIPHVADAYVETAKKALRKIGLETQQSFLRGGLVACTGAAYCKYAQTNTKAHALALADYLEKKLALDQPINIHLTGCPNSCAQHYIGDIGLLGVKVKNSASGEGYHVFVGGGFGANAALGRQVFSGISFDELKTTLEKMLRGYLRRRQPGESFRAFTQRHDLNALQAIFSNDE